MTNYTPDTATVRNAYTRALRQAFIASAGEHDEEFDRWLRQVQSEAWGEGAGSAFYDPESRDLIGCRDNPYRTVADD